MTKKQFYITGFIVSIIYAIIFVISTIYYQVNYEEANWGCLISSFVFYFLSFVFSNFYKIENEDIKRKKIKIIESNQCYTIIRHENGERSVLDNEEWHYF